MTTTTQRALGQALVQANQLVARAGLVAMCSFASCASVSAVAEDELASDLASAQFSPDGTVLATGHDDGIIRLWDVATGAACGTIRTGQSCRISSLAFSPDGSVLASSGWNCPPSVWDVEARTRVGTLPRLWPMLLWHPVKDRILIVDDPSTAFWDIEKEAIVGRLPDAYGEPAGTPMAVSPKADRLLTLQRKEIDMNGQRGLVAQLVLWNLMSRKPVGLLEPYVSRGGHSTTFSRDGTMFATFTSCEGIVVARADRASIEQIMTLKTSWLGETLLFSPDNSVLMAVGGKLVRIWSIPDGVQLTKKYPWANERLCGAVMTRDGQKVAFYGTQDEPPFFRIVATDTFLPTREESTEARKRWSQLIGHWTTVEVNEVVRRAGIIRLSLSLARDGSCSAVLEGEVNGRQETRSDSGTFWLNENELEASNWQDGRLGKMTFSFDGDQLKAAGLPAGSKVILERKAGAPEGTEGRVEPTKK